MRTDLTIRMDRLAWGAFHWRLVVALGVTWVLDGLEVTLVGAIGAALQRSPVLGLGPEGVGEAASTYLIGNILGAIAFGVLADRLGRKRLFNITLILYLAATAATAFAWDFPSFLFFRFATGAGIGGEGTAIASAILEFTPARHRGRVHLALASTYWSGAAIGAIMTIPLLNPNLFAPELGWRFAFGSGAVVATVVLYLRRFIPESPRWLLSQNRQADAEAIVVKMELETMIGVKQPDLSPTTAKHDSVELPISPSSSTEYWKALLRYIAYQYRSRSILITILLVTQAFLYNAIFFTYALILANYYNVAVDKVGAYIALFAVANLIGPVLFGRAFDTVGRTPLIVATYAASGFLLLGVAWLFGAGKLDAVTQTLAWSIIFVFASAGASGAYLTVAESFPIEVRAGSIALFYTFGTLIGGVGAPWFLSRLIASGDRSQIVFGYLLAATLMLIGAATDLFLGFDAERRPLEQVAPSRRTPSIP